MRAQGVPPVRAVGRLGLSIAGGREHRTVHYISSHPLSRGISRLSSSTMFDRDLSCFFQALDYVLGSSLPLSCHALL